jgi:hypothetical protein
MNRVSLLFIFILSASHSWAFDFPPPKNAKTIVYTYSAYSWDNSEGWVILSGAKTVTETFDPGGRILSRALSNPDGTPIEKTTFSYSAGGYRGTTTDHKNEVTRYADIAATGSKIVETVRRADGSPFATYKTDKGTYGLPSREEYRDSAGRMIWRISYSYSEGACVEIAYANPEGSIAFASTLEYGKIDDHGNWTECTHYVSYADVRSRPKEIIRRGVEYWR